MSQIRPHARVFGDGPWIAGCLLVEELGYLRAISVALASQDFEAVYDEMLRDERLSDSEKDVIATATLEMEQRLLAFL